MEDWELDFHWQRVRHLIKRIMNQDTLPDLNMILLLIGIQELGQVRKKFSKEEKQDLMHIAVCTLLEPEGYFTFTGIDDDGWPHWDMNKPFTMKGVSEQESFLKYRIIDYFKDFEGE